MYSFVSFIEIVQTALFGIPKAYIIERVSVCQAISGKTLSDGPWPTDAKWSGCL